MRQYRASGQRNLRLFLILALVLISIGVVYRAHKSDSPIKSRQTSIDRCVKLDVRYQNQYSCYKAELTKIINQQGAEPAVSLLKNQYQSVAYVKSNCHQLMHVVGRATYAKYANLAEAFAHGDQFCWSGFYHGIMEQVSIDKGYDYIIKNANTICQPIADKYGQGSFYDYNCVHGLGHGFMEVLNNNLFNSLSSCDSMQLSWNRTSCYGGVFMQNIMNVQGPEAENITSYPYLKTDQPMYPCTAVDDKYKEQCYLMQTSYALQVESYDFNRVFDLCANVESPYSDTCYQSLGRDASGQTISNIQKTKNICLEGKNNDAQTNCVVGAVKDFVSYFHSDKKGYELCATMPDNIAGTCSSTVAAYYSTF